MTQGLKLGIASDHGAIELKTAIIEHIKNNHPTIQITNLGVDAPDSVDYPDYADKTCKAVLEREINAGILCCGTGIGMSIRANRHKGIRAALVFNDFTAQMAKEHNNANMLCLGGRTTPEAEACKLVDIWLTSTFEGGRHQRRLDKLEQ